MNQWIIKALEEAASEQDLNFNAVVEIHKNSVTIDTRISRDPSQNANGGDYNYWLKIWPHRNNILMQEKCSCDFWQPQNEPDFVAGFTSDEWNKLVTLIKSRAKRLQIPILERL